MSTARCHYQLVYDKEWSLDDYEFSDIAGGPSMCCQREFPLCMKIRASVL